MVAIAAYNSKLQITGTSTAITDEPCTTTGVDPSKVSQITDTAKRILDPAIAVSVKDGAGAAVSAANYTVNYMFGKINHSAIVDSTGPGVRVTGQYLPLLTVANCRVIALQQGRKPLNISVFDDAITAERYLMGLRSLNGSFEIIDSPYVDLDSGGGIVELFDILKQATDKVLTFRLGGAGGDELRCWVKLVGLDDSAGVEDLYKRRFNFVGCGFSHANVHATSEASWKWNYE